MSGYGPFSWSYGLSVIRTIAEPAWYYERTAIDYGDPTKTAWKPRSASHTKPKLPIATYVGWILLRIALCIDIALINELVGYFVLKANPHAVAFIGAVGGAISTILLFILDIVYSKPEKRERWPMIDPNSTIKNQEHDTGLYNLLKEKWKPPVGTAPASTSGGSATPAADLTHELHMRGDPADAKNYTEGGPITLRKLRTHAVMRLLIWALVAVLAGAVGTALWLVQDGKKVKNMMKQILTGIVVQLVGVAVIVVGPTIIQVFSLAVEGGENARRRRIPKEPTEQ